MRLRKLSAAEAARLCACGLFPYEAHHAHDCRIWRDQECARLRARIAALETRLAQLISPAAAKRHIPVRFDPPHWRCASCNTDTFARSVRDPDRCTRCASVVTNGHLVAA